VPRGAARRFFYAAPRGAARQRGAPRGTARRSAAKYSRALIFQR